MYHRDRDPSAWPTARETDETLELEDAVAHDSGDGMWRQVVDAMPGFVMILNRDYVCTYVSPGVTRELGVLPRDVIGTRPETLVDPEHLPDVWRGRAASATGERGVVTRMRVNGPDGLPRWYESTSTQLVDPATEAVCTALHVRDVTSEVESQVTLTCAVERYLCVLSAIDEAVLQLDGQGRIESFNGQALSLVRRSAEELLGADVVAVLDLRDQDGRPVTGPVADALAATSVEPAGQVWRSILRGDGDRRLVRITLGSFDGPGPQGGGAVLILKEPGAPGTDGTPPAPTMQQARSAAGLTAREGDVLNGLAGGGDVPTIARQLGISVHSVRGHVKSITAKLGVHSQLQAVIAASRRGMIDLARRE